MTSRTRGSGRRCITLTRAIGSKRLTGSIPRSGSTLMWTSPISIRSTITLMMPSSRSVISSCVIACTTARAARSGLCSKARLTKSSATTPPTGWRAYISRRARWKMPCWPSIASKVRSRALFATTSTSCVQIFTWRRTATTSRSRSSSSCRVRRATVASPPTTSASPTCRVAVARRLCSSWNAPA